MLKIIVISAFTVLFLIPSIAASGEHELSILKAYLEGDFSKLESHLSPDFKYQYYEKNKIKVLSRSEDLESMRRILKDTMENRIGQPEFMKQDKKNKNKFHVKFDIFFEDSPKIYTDSFFRGDSLNIDETLTVSFDENNKISHIAESRSKNMLTFGYLKNLYLRDLDSISRDDKGRIVKFGEIYVGDLTSELSDRNTHELLLIQKRKNKMSCVNYYWPNMHRVKNFFDCSK